MAGWSYVVTRINGDGTEAVLENEVPIQGGVLTDDLSGPGGLTGTVSPEMPRLDRDKLFVPWKTGVYAEADGHIRGGGIFTNLIMNGPTYDLDCIGHSGYLNGQPYNNVTQWINADPMTVHKHLWEYAQSLAGGNLGVTVDDSASPLLLGTDEEPFKLNYWSTHNLGKTQDDVAAKFDYLMVHSWDGETIRHELVRGYPRLGQRLDRRFVLGENLFTTPPIEYSGDYYANEITVLGAGEGPTQIRSDPAVRNDGRIRRAKTIVDKNIRTKEDANRRARRELAARAGDPDITSLAILNHPHAPIGTYNVGDEILTQTTGETEMSIWGRILSKQLSPDTDETVVKLARVERV